MKKISVNVVALWVIGAMLAVMLCSTVAFANVRVLGKLTHEMTVLSGQKVHGSIVLANSGSIPIEVDIELRDYTFSADGTDDYLEPGTNARSNARWLVVAPARLVVPARQLGIVYYTVSVPNDPTLKGTYWSILLIKPKTDAQMVMFQSKGGFMLGIQTNLEYGVQLVTNIGSTGSKSLRIMDRKVVRDQDGYYSLWFALENSGERWIRPEIRVEVYDMSGALVGKYSGDRLRLYPGTSVASRIALGILPRGRYKAVLIIDDGGSNVWAAQYIWTIS
ncbi:MAG TPA: hypothetical protein PLM83_06975 [Bacillota bacterium]|nr:hypothetical protein [Bacillota bacterium]